MKTVNIPIKWLSELIALCGPEDHELRERVMVSTSPKAQADALDVGRSDAEIASQTEELARYLLSWRWGQEPEQPDTQMRSSKNPRAQKSWQAACEIQELITATDAENAAVEVDAAIAAAKGEINEQDR